MKNSLLFFTILSAAFSFGQYALGTRTITFNDPSRLGSNGQPRPIECAVYYPAETAGNNTPVAFGSFPIVVFGHGFAMQWSAYQNVWEFLSLKGYILIFPKTESGISPAPSHNDFALDLAFVSDQMLANNSNTTSPFYQKINGRSGLMGHSMGGGATMLAAKNNFNIKTIVGLAPAETNPSAIDATADIVVPALVLSGASDGVTPPADHHLPIFNGLISLNKTFISITGGAHCYFANTNLPCDFGESSTSIGIAISRAQQQAFMNSTILPWLDFYLKGKCEGYTQFQSAMSQPGLVTNHISNYVPITYDISTNNTSPGQSTGSAFVSWTGGTFPVDFSWYNGSTNPELNNLSAGNYGFTITDNFCTLEGTAIIGDGTAKVEQISFSSPNYYPNPTRDYVLLDFQRSAFWKIAVCDITGKTIHQLSTNLTNSVNIDLSYFESGVYMLMIQENQGEIQSIRVIKE